MIGHFEGLTDELAKCAKQAERNTRGKVGKEYEDIVTARFLQSFSEAVETYGRKNPYNVDIQTHKLPDAGENSAESKFGADFLICFDVQLADFEMSNGILVQAKRGDVDEFPPMKTIRDQSEKMLQWSPDSFINVLNNRSYRMYPAIQMARSDGNKPTYRGEDLEFDEAFDYRTTLKLYSLLFKGYVGDNWVYQNVDFLTDPKNHGPNSRPLAPDGGQIENGGGMKALIISISDPNEYVELPFDREKRVDSFIESGFESFE